jgi:hypothetical protein
MAETEHPVIDRTLVSRELPRRAVKAGRFAHFGEMRPRLAPGELGSAIKS